MTEKPETTIVRVTSYRQDELVPAVRNAIKALVFDIQPGSNILIKPNIMSQNPPHHHTITHPAFIDAICSVLQEKKCSITIGESIAFYEKGLTEKAFITSGLQEVACKYQAKTIAFEKSQLRKVILAGKNRTDAISELFIPEIVFESDIIINACKLKTHQGLLRLSGAIKNLFGLLPGGYKQKIHRLCSDDMELAELIIGLHHSISPEGSPRMLHLMDAIYGLDGGPTGLGKPTLVGAVLASLNPAALDVVAAEIIGYLPEEISFLVKAKEKGMIADFDNISITGEIPHVPFKRLVKGTLPAEKTHQKKGVFVTQTYVFPFICRNRCTDCGSCIDFCPVSAVSRKDKRKYIIDYNTCIYCYHCYYQCPHKAVRFHSTLMNKLIRLGRKILNI